jgi:hypothetical protein
MTLYTRVNPKGPTVTLMGRIADGHPSVGDLCPSCGARIRAGDHTGLIPLGPGADPQEQAAARAGRSYDAAAVLVHWSCATGIV